MTRLVVNPPAGQPKTSRRCLTGKVSLANGEGAFFQSSLERDWLLVLDFDPTVRRIVEQPFSIFYKVNGQERRYTPDVLAEHASPDGVNKTVVYEVKPREELSANWAKYKTRFKVAVRRCREEGWRFKIVTEKEIRTPLLDNARFLRRYRSLPDNALTREQLLYTLKGLGQTTPQALLAAAYWHEEPQMAALPTLWKLIASRAVITMLHEPLTMGSSIWLPEE